VCPTATIGLPVQPMSGCGPGPTPDCTARPPRALVWRGIDPDGAPGGWTTNQNVRVWRNVATGEPAAYCDGDFVAFTDEGMVADIQIQDGDVRPGDVLFDHGLAVATYTLLAGGIAGSTVVTKQGPGSLVVSNANTFTGGTQHREGIIFVDDKPMGTNPIEFTDTGDRKLYGTGTNPKVLNKLVFKTSRQVEISPGTSAQSLPITQGIQLDVNAELFLRGTILFESAITDGATGKSLKLSGAENAKVIITKDSGTFSGATTVELLHVTVQNPGKNPFGTGTVTFKRESTLTGPGNIDAPVVIDGGSLNPGPGMTIKELKINGGTSKLRIAEKLTITSSITIAGNPKLFPVKVVGAAPAAKIPLIDLPRNVMVKPGDFVDADGRPVNEDHVFKLIKDPMMPTVTQNYTITFKDGPDGNDVALIIKP